MRIAIAFKYIAIDIRYCHLIQLRLPSQTVYCSYMHVLLYAEILNKERKVRFYQLHAYYRGLTNKAYVHVPVRAWH